MKNYSNVSNEIVNVDKQRFPYLFPVSATLGKDGAALVKKGVISSMNATKSPVSSTAISAAVSGGAR